MEKEGQSSSEPVTALIVRNVKPERIEEFEKWALGMHHVVRGFEGYLGTDIIRPRGMADEVGGNDGWQNARSRGTRIYTLVCPSRCRFASRHTAKV
jgi:antibiotic biosynthesis monooxygenase (ABM) superfamily enzyme